MESKFEALKQRVDRIGGRANALQYAVAALIASSPNTAVAVFLKELPQLAQALESGLESVEASDEYLNGQRDVFEMLPLFVQKLGSLPWLEKDG